VCKYEVSYGGGCSPGIWMFGSVGGNGSCAGVEAVVVGVVVAVVVVVVVVVEVVVAGVVVVSYVVVVVVLVGVMVVVVVLGVVVRVVVVVVVVRFVVVVVVVGAGGGMTGPVVWFAVCTTAKMIAAMTSTPSTPAALMAPVV
jgi:hypothetical protein